MQKTDNGNLTVEEVQRAVKKLSVSVLNVDNQIFLNNKLFGEVNKNGVTDKKGPQLLDFIIDSGFFKGLS